MCYSVDEIVHGITAWLHHTYEDWEPNTRLNGFTVGNDTLYACETAQYAWPVGRRTPVCCCPRHWLHKELASGRSVCE